MATPPRRGARSARVTTRTGDRGETSLFGGERVPKTDPRVEALGDLDEAQAALGVARARLRGAVADTILRLQRGLYLVMAEVGTPTDRVERLATRIDAAAVAEIDALGAELRGRTDIAGRFVVPGESARSAALDVARTVTRRAERRVVGCVARGLVSGEHIVPWLNRLSDVLFVLARGLERKSTPASQAPRRRSG